MNRMFTHRATPRSSHQRRCGIALALLVSSFTTLPPGSAAAATYRWVDAEGVIHFSQTLPDQLATQPERVDLDQRLMAAMPRQPQSALPIRIVEGYCREIRDRTRDEAERMLKQNEVTARHRRLLTEADDREGARVRKQLIHHVLGFRNAGVSAGDIASLAMNQCLNGLYQDDIESYVRREHPKLHDSLYR